MKLIIRLWAYSSLFCCHALMAEVVTDGTMGAIKSLAGNMTISQELGKTVGSNLFHSFQTFNINTGESATFTGANSLKNVISRVTGGEISNINGLLKSAIGNANFYFINPAGIVFGANAQVDVPAAFHISTSDNLKFSDGSVFSASDKNASSLTIAEPQSFGFLTNQAGDIKIQSGGDYFPGHYDADEEYIYRYYVGNHLSFKHNNEVSFNAANIIIDHGSLLNPSGTITLNASKNITFTHSSVDTSTEMLSNGGNIATSKGGNITMLAPNVTLDSAIIISDTNDASTGGGVTVNSESLMMRNGTEIGSSTFSAGNAGSVLIEAKKLIIDDSDSNSQYASGIHAGAEPNSSGNAGTVTINSDEITLRGGGQIATETLGTGKAGAVLIQAKELIIDANGSYYATGISADTGENTTGDAGSITVNSDKITLLHEGVIFTSTHGAGNGGLVKILAKELVIDSGNSISATGILSNSNADSTGNAGSVLINSSKITLINGGQISSRTFGEGNAGDVTIHADTIDIHGKNDAGASAKISAQVRTSSSGQIGSVKVTANKSILLDDSGTITIQNDGVTPSDAATNGSQLSVSAPLISINNALITAKTTNTGNAGSVTITATNTLTETNNASITSSTSGSGDAGTITIQVGTLELINAASIESNTYTVGKAGITTVNAKTITIGKDSYISSASIGANSSGQPGNVFINASTALQLMQGKISIQNDATVADSDVSSILPSLIKITAADIALTNSKITSTANGNLDAGKINLNFSHWLTLTDNSGINSEANTGNGGSLAINGGELINLQHSNIETYTEGFNSDEIFKGGDISIRADILAMNTAQILSREGTTIGGYANLNLKGIIASQNQLEVNGKTQAGFEAIKIPLNIMRTADSGWVTPQLNLTGSISSLNHKTLELPDLTQDACSANHSSSLVRKSKGGVFATETKSVFVPLFIHIGELQSAIPLNTNTVSFENNPCGRLSHYSLYKTITP